jgi:hypothetical protein
MSSLTAGNAPARRLVLMFAGTLLSASAALAGEPGSDTQALARQFILGTPVSEADARASGEPTSAASAVGSSRVDPQEYVRQFILGTPNVEFVADSSERASRLGAAPGIAHVDPQERVRVQILGAARLT